MIDIGVILVDLCFSRIPYLIIQQPSVLSSLDIMFVHASDLCPANIQGKDFITNHCAYICNITQSVLGDQYLGYLLQNETDGLQIPFDR